MSDEPRGSAFDTGLFGQAGGFAVRIMDLSGGKDEAWRSAAELNDFARRPVMDAEERNWRILDPRRDEADADEEDEEP